MNAFTRSIATDYAKDGIRCNTLAPGYVINEGREVLTEEQRTKINLPDEVAREGEDDDDRTM